MDPTATRLLNRNAGRYSERDSRVVGNFRDDPVAACLSIPDSREILRSVPNLQREAAYALGGTRWEVTRIAVLSYAKKGLFGAAILGLGRALGETMAVTMVIGNRPEISASLFAPGYTLASVIANEFNEVTTDVYTHALFEIGLVLLG